METKEAKVELTDKMKSVMDTIEKMTVMELADLVKALEDKFGVVAAAAVAVSGGGAAAGAAAPAAEEKSTFTVVLANAGASKIQVIKELRTITSLGLKEAKDIAEATPKETDGIIVPAVVILIVPLIYAYPTVFVAAVAIVVLAAVLKVDCKAVAVANVAVPF